MQDPTETTTDPYSGLDSQGFVRSMVEAVSEPLLMLDAELRVHHANRAFYRTFQVTPAETEGQFLYDLSNGQWNIPRLRALLDETPSERTTFDNLEVTWDFPALGRKVIRLSSRSLLQADGEVILLTIADVTKQNGLEVERREIKTHFNALIKILKGQAVFGLDRSGHITSWNSAAQRVLGFTEAEILGQPFDRIFVPEDRQLGAPEAELRDAREQGRVEGQRWYLRKGGDRFWGLGILSAVNDPHGRLTGYMKIVRDRSASRRAEQALRESEERFRRLVQASSEVIYRMSPDWSELRNLVGRQFVVDTREPTRQWLEKYISPEDQQRVQRAYEEAIRTRSVFELEYRVARPDGSIGWTASRAIPILNDNGEITEWFGMGSDITARKQAEQALLESQQQLRALASELSQTERRERKHLAKVVHDHIQQLIVAASIQVGALKQASHRESLDAITKRLEQVLREAIDATRSLSVELSPPVLDEVGLVGALKWLAARLQKQNQFHLELRTDPSAEPADHDLRYLLFEAVRELLLNAIKHANVSEAEVVLRRCSGSAIELIVRDAGRGFDPEWIQARPVEECGFGIFSIRERLVHLGGHMEIASAPGRGTNVTLRIEAPVAERRPGRLLAECAAGKPPAVHFRRRTEVCRVLIVDDHPVLREGVIRLFDFEPDVEVVGQASDGEEALMAVSALAPDVVLMDINLGDGMDGIEVTRQVLTAYPDTEVIGLSMYPDAAVADAMLEAGAVAYLRKDSQLDALLGLIRGCGQPNHPLAAGVGEGDYGTSSTLT
jgi:PAS domain S-box-containing protein